MTQIYGTRLKNDDDDDVENDGYNDDDLPLFLIILLKFERSWISDGVESHWLDSDIYQFKCLKYINIFTFQYLYI